MILIPGTVLGSEIKTLNTHDTDYGDKK